MAPLGDDGDLQALRHVQAFAFDDNRMDGLTRRYGAKFVGGRSVGDLEGLAIAVARTDLVNAALDAVEIRPAMRMVARGVGAAPAHDVGPHGPFIEVWKRIDDLGWRKGPGSVAWQSRRAAASTSW